MKPDKQTEFPEINDLNDYLRALCGAVIDKEMAGLEASLWKWDALIARRSRKAIWQGTCGLCEETFACQGCLLKSGDTLCFHWVEWRNMESAKTNAEWLKNARAFRRRIKRATQ